MFISNKVALTAYTDDTIKQESSILHGLNVLAWEPPHGRHLVWMDEIGRLNTKAVMGFLIMDFKAVAERNEAVARRAILTNSDDIGKTLEDWQALGTGNLPPLSALPTPALISLGIMRGQNTIMDSDDVGLPLWAWGHKIIEVEEPIGCFAALGYCRRGENKRFKVGQPYYVPLLVEEQDITATA